MQRPRCSTCNNPLRATPILGRLSSVLGRDLVKQTIAERLGTFVADTTFEQLPREVVDKAKRHILDTFGAALVGATSEEAGRARAALVAIEGSGIAPVWGRCESVAPRNAALLNGIAAHAFELDDTGGCDHSGAVVLPAAVAALSLLDKPVSGRAFITAVVLGYDVGRRALEGFGGYRPHNEAGWHSTGTCGTFAAAAACAGLPRPRGKLLRRPLGVHSRRCNGEARACRARRRERLTCGSSRPREHDRPNACLRGRLGRIS